MMGEQFMVGWRKRVLAIFISALMVFSQGMDAVVAYADDYNEAHNHELIVSTEELFAAITPEGSTEQPSTEDVQVEEKTVSVVASEDVELSDDSEKETTEEDAQDSEKEPVQEENKDDDADTEDSKDETADAVVDSNELSDEAANESAEEVNESESADLSSDNETEKDSESSSDEASSSEESSSDESSSSDEASSEDTEVASDTLGVAFFDEATSDLGAVASEEEQAVEETADLESETGDSQEVAEVADEEIAETTDTTADEVASDKEEQATDDTTDETVEETEDTAKDETVADDNDETTTEDSKDDTTDHTPVSAENLVVVQETTTKEYKLTESAKEVLEKISLPHDSAAMKNDIAAALENKVIVKFFDHEDLDCEDCQAIVAVDPISTELSVIGVNGGKGKHNFHLKIQDVNGTPIELAEVTTVIKQAKEKTMSPQALLEAVQDPEIAVENVVISAAKEDKKEEATEEEEEKQEQEDKQDPAQEDKEVNKDATEEEASTENGSASGSSEENASEENSSDSSVEEAVDTEKDSDSVASETAKDTEAAEEDSSEASSEESTSDTDTSEESSESNDTEESSSESSSDEASSSEESSSDESSSDDSSSDASESTLADSTIMEQVSGDATAVLTEKTEETTDTAVSTSDIMTAVPSGGIMLMNTSVDGKVTTTVPSEVQKEGWLSFYSVDQGGNALSETYSIKSDGKPLKTTAVEDENGWSYINLKSLFGNKETWDKTVTVQNSKEELLFTVRVKQTSEGRYNKVYTCTFPEDIANKNDSVTQLTTKGKKYAAVKIVKPIEGYGDSSPATIGAFKSVLHADSSTGKYTIAVDSSGTPKLTWSSVDAVVPANVVIVLDMSDSMDGDRWTTTQKAVKAMTTALLGNGENTQNQVAVVGFSSKTDSKWQQTKNAYGIYQNFTSKPKDVTDAISGELKDVKNKHSLGAGTNAQAGFIGAREILSSANSTRQNFVVFISDGRSYGYLDLNSENQDEIYVENDANKWDTVRWEAVSMANTLSKDATIFTLGLDLGKDNNAVSAKNMLKSCASANNFFTDTTTNKLVEKMTELGVKIQYTKKNVTDHKTVTITDPMSIYVDYEKDSAKVQRYTNTWEDYTDAIISYNNDNRTITANINNWSSDCRYRLVYDVQVKSAFAGKKLQPDQIYGAEDPVETTSNENTGVQANGPTYIQSDIVSSQEIKVPTVYLDKDAVINDGSITFNKVDENKQPLAGATFGLYTSKDFTAGPIKTATSDKDGKVSFTGLAASAEGTTYYIKETNAPAGYQLQDTIYVVLLKKTDKKEDRQKKQLTIDCSGQTTTGQTNIINVPSKTVNIEVTKKWVDGQKTHPAITVQLQQSLTNTTDDSRWTAVAGVEPKVLNSANEWKCTFENQPAFSQSKSIYYRAVETNRPENYKVTYEITRDLSNDNFIEVITNTTTSDFMGSVTFTKKDTDSGYTLSGAEFTIYPTKADAEKGTNPIETVPSGTNGIVTFNNLKISKDTDIATYYFKETKVPKGYKSQNIIYMVKLSKTNPNVREFYVDCDDTKTPVTTIYNNKIEAREITISKWWNDGKEQNDSSHKTVTVKLQSTLMGSTNWTDVIGNESIELSANNKWSKILSLPILNEDEKGITYRIVETEIPIGYEPSYSSITDSAGYVTALKVTNNLTEPGNVTITGTKTWADQNNLFNSRPESINLTLLADGKEVTGAVPSWTKDGNTWTYTFTGLKQYKDAASGDYTKIVYTVKEAAVTNYTASYDATHLNITNKLNTSDAAITATKKVTNFAGYNPEEFTITLSGPLNQSYTATATPTEAGKAVSFTFTNTKGETLTNLPYGEYTVTEANGTNFKLSDIKVNTTLKAQTNGGPVAKQTHKTFTLNENTKAVSIDVINVPNNSGNSVTMIKQMAPGQTAIGEDPIFTFDLMEGTTTRELKFTPNESKELNKLNSGDTYKIKETNAESYNLTLTLTVGTEASKTLTPDADGWYSFTVPTDGTKLQLIATNSLKDQTVTLHKIVTGVTPNPADAFTFKVWTAAKGTTIPADAQTVTLKANETKTLSSMKQGVTYYIQETTGTDKYTLSMTGATSVEGTENLYQFTPGSTTLSLTATNTAKTYTGGKLKKVVIGGSGKTETGDQTMFQFNIYDQSKDGTLVGTVNASQQTDATLPSLVIGKNYYLEEIPTAGYTLESVNGSNSNQELKKVDNRYEFSVDVGQNLIINVKNRQTSDLKLNDVKVTKALTAQSGEEGTFTFSLKQGNKTLATGTVTTDAFGTNNTAPITWIPTDDFPQNDKDDNGVAYLKKGSYTIEEAITGNYAFVSITGDATQAGDRIASFTINKTPQALNITFTNKPLASTEITVTKTWDNKGFNVSLPKPEDVSFQLYADGSKVEATGAWTTTQSNIWTYTFSNIPKYNTAGTAVIQYTVVEVMNADASARYTAGTPTNTPENPYTFSVTNTLKTTGTDGVTATKNINRISGTNESFQLILTDAYQNTYEATATIKAGEEKAEFIFTNGNQKLTDLPYGTYTISEADSTKYQLNTIRVTANSADTDYKGDTLKNATFTLNDSNKSVKLLIVNAAKLVTLNLTKTIANGQTAINGQTTATFNLTSTGFVSSSTVNVALDGKSTTVELQAGQEYTLTEQDASNYVLSVASATGTTATVDGNKITFTTPQDNTATISIHAVNSLIPNNNVTLIKAIDGTPINTADTFNFTIWEKGTTKPAEPNVTNVPINADGIKLSNLYQGKTYYIAEADSDTYTLKEISGSQKVAGENYYEFTVNEQQLSLTATNTAKTDARMILTKTVSNDPTNKQTFTFNVYTEASESADILNTQTVSVGKSATFEGLTYGKTYFIKEDALTGFKANGITGTGVQDAGNGFYSFVVSSKTTLALTADNLVSSVTVDKMTLTKQLAADAQSTGLAPGTFNFTIKGPDGFTDQNIDLTLNAGSVSTSKDLTNLRLPLGSYTVTEADNNANFQLQGFTVSINGQSPNDDNTFTVTPDTKSIAITATNELKKPALEVTAIEQLETGTSSELLSTNPVNFTLSKNGTEIATGTAATPGNIIWADNFNINSLPIGKYTITQSANNILDFVSLNVQGATDITQGEHSITFTINANTTKVDIVCVNKAKTNAKVSITKQLTNNTTDLTTSFAFNIYENATDNNNAIANVSLKAGETKDITGLVYGKTYYIAEADSQNYKLSSIQGATPVDPENPSGRYQFTVLSSDGLTLTAENTIATLDSNAITLNKKLPAIFEDTTFNFTLSASDSTTTVATGSISTAGNHEALTSEAGAPVTLAWTDGYQPKAGVTYTISETANDIYHQTGLTINGAAGTSTNTFTIDNKTNTVNITFTNQVTEKKDATVTVNKEWVDNNDLTQRPEDLVLTLSATNATDFTVQTSAKANWNKDNNQWTYTFNELPKYTTDGSQEIVYSVTEEVPANYTQSAIPDSNPYVFNLRNTLKTSEATVTATKEVTALNGYAPEQFELTITNMNISTDTLSPYTAESGLVSEANTTVDFQFDEIPAGSSVHGNTLNMLPYGTYKVEESASANFTNKSILISVNGGTATAADTFTINEDTTSVAIQVVNQPKDLGNLVTLRKTVTNPTTAPETFTFSIQEQGTDVTQTFTVEAEADAINIGGQLKPETTYIISEEAFTGYRLTGITGTTSDTDGNNIFTTPALDGTTINLVATNDDTRIPETALPTIVKEITNGTGVVPDNTFTVTLIGTDDTRKEITLSGTEQSIPDLHYGVQYTIQENTVNAPYQFKGITLNGNPLAANEEGQFTFTLSREQRAVITVQNEYAPVPDGNITLTKQLTNGSNLVQQSDTFNFTIWPAFGENASATTIPENAIKITVQGLGTANIPNLLQGLNYYIREDLTDGSRYRLDSIAGEGLTAVQDISGTYTFTAPANNDTTLAFTATNAVIPLPTPIPETVDINGIKEWNDKNDADRIRPNSITVRLYADGIATDKTAIVTPDSNGLWSFKFVAQAKFSGAKEIEYTVREENLPQGYTAAYNTNADGTLEIINTHTPSNPVDPDEPDEPDNPDKPTSPDVVLPDNPNTPDSGGGNRNPGGNTTGGNGGGTPNTVDINDSDVPLAALPPSNELEEIFDEDVPLAGGFAMESSGIIGLGLLGLGMLLKHRRSKFQSKKDKENPS